MDPRPESRQSPWQATPGGVFLSYRRGDSLSTTARLADDLVDYFGRRRVYRDVDSNRAGQDFVEQIHAALQGAQAVVAVIGSEWVSARDADGVQRLHDPEDPVRIEIVAALEADVPIIPVLVGGATMPKAGEVPASVRPLCKIHALRLADDDWRYDLSRLLETLEDHGVVPSAEPTEPAPAAATGELLKPRRFERTVKISRRGAYRAVVRAVHALHYGVLSEDPEAASITFRPWEAGAEAADNPREPKAAQRVAATVKVVDAGPGQATVVVELRTVKTGYLAGGALALAAFTSGVGLVAWPALRMWEKRFARGFLDNVAGVLEGRGIGTDSALPPGVEKWRNRTEKV